MIIYQDNPITNYKAVLNGLLECNSTMIKVSIQKNYRFVNCSFQGFAYLNTQFYNLPDSNFICNNPLGKTIMQVKRG